MHAPQRHSRAGDAGSGDGDRPCDHDHHTADAPCAPRDQHGRAEETGGTPDLEAWKTKLRARFDRQARELGLTIGRAWEAFVLTAWGIVPSLEQLERDLPLNLSDPARRTRLAERIARWVGAE